MFLPVAKRPRKTNRRKSARYRAELKAKNRARRRRMGNPP